ncbi:D-glutamate cyclase, mitochondrial-like [Antedon mediterranea]|uniref:D-glutamate cyclase, mitochondrial-like n=1 Tax=Antedon mediterranea TaxID=105859 RepID=UPI003AF53475
MISANTLPGVARLAIRTGNHFKLQTSGVCQGYYQANLTILPSKYAVDFEKFCQANTGAFPLLFQSKPGQCDAPALSKSDSNIRTDIPAYCVWENGKKVDVVGDLMKYAFSDFCTSYLGCSFTFDQRLLDAGVPLRNVEQNTNVSMYVTNIPCYPVGPFACNLVVSLRPIPKNLVETAFRITSPLEKAHGAPIHIGNPALIGINDISKPDFGAVLPFKENDVPVFWACGVTGLEAVKALKPDMAFTHNPGSMYLCDTPLDDGTDTNPDDSRVIDLTSNPYSASVASDLTVKTISKLEKLIATDPGDRGIGNLIVENDLLKSALSLSHASSVAIVTGFPCMVDTPSLYENDGLSGAVTLAVMLQSLGKEVSFIADDGTFDSVMNSFVNSLLEKGILTKPIPVVTCPSDIDKSKASEFLTGSEGPRFDHLVAIERSGIAADGGFYTMKGRDISKHLVNIDLLFEAAKSIPGVSTTGVGDGGNELGMGKVFEKVHKHIPLGEKIACVTSTDYLVATGVSNWGGYGLSAAVALLNLCPIHDRYVRRSSGFPRQKHDIVMHLPTVENEKRTLEVLLDMGIYDGILGKRSLSVDGLPFEGVHSKMVQDIIAIF